MPHKDPARRKAYQRHYRLTHSRVHGGLRHPNKWRRDLIAREMAPLVGLALPKAEKVVNAILEVITASLKRGESVSVPGFGKFLISPLYKKVYFLPSKQLVYLVKHPDYKL